MSPRLCLYAASLVALGGALLACDDPAGAPAGTPDAAEVGVPDTSTPEEEEVGAPDAQEETPPEVVAPVGLPILGAGSQDPAGLTIEVLLDGEDGLVSPRDLAFNPMVVDGVSQLFVADADMNMFVVTNPGTPEVRVRARNSLGSEHFMPAPVGLAFSDIGTFATVHETDWVTQQSTPADFMGPTLWPADAGEFDGGWASHLDMLHNSPNAVGIAWDQGNAFWVFDGAHSSITWYDFQADHGPGGEDHSDGIIVRWVEGQVKYVPGVTSDMQLDHATGLLYVADSGNARVAVLDTRSGARGGTLRPNYDGAEMYHWKDASLTTLVDLTAHGATRPTGLALHGGLVWVSDNATSRIFAFDPTSPETPIDWLDLSSVVPAGSLGAIAFDAQGRLLALDVAGARVLRLSAP